MKKENNLCLVRINSDYCNYLRKFDERVSYNANKKQLRPFVGVLLEINKLKYFAPLSSPKPKHLKMKNMIDFYKIDEGRLGAINFNNMIPVNEGDYTIININEKTENIDEKHYLKLLDTQLRWLIRNGDRLNEVAQKLYNKRVSGKLNEYICERCCDFKLLEGKALEYSSTINKNISYNTIIKETDKVHVR